MKAWRDEEIEEKREHVRARRERERERAGERKK